MIRAAARLAALACAALSSSSPADTMMPDPSDKPALYRIVDRRADGRCVWATMKPARTGGDPMRALFCNELDVAYLADPSPRHAMATLLDKNGAEPRLLPVTVGLDVSVGGVGPAGDILVMALPRPSPLRLSPSAAGLKEMIESAARTRRPVAFALSDDRRIIDAAPIDRPVALAMLGMRE